jgi:hypothetical protein
MATISRRGFLHQASHAAVAATAYATGATLVAQEPPAPTIETLPPRNRAPLSFIIDDSTCLVNMGHYCMPQFAEAWPDREIYQRPWKTWPREIPDDFVREFGEWCGERGIKGKYSVVPNPACVGWLDRGLPGWSRDALQQSLRLIRDFMAPNWDIHPEMITHTRVIDLKTGRPLEPAADATMENSFPQDDISVDELAAYLAYALQILKNCDLPCEGITTPGGFGNRVKEKLPRAVHQAVREVYGAELPHFFKYVADDLATEPTLEFLTDRRDASQLTMNIPAGTGDWFGGWDGDETPQPDLYATADASSGRMVELIEAGRPAIMLCHWPGIYTHGTKRGFHAFQQVASALAARFERHTLWMKPSDIGRYWAAKELTDLAFEGDSAVSIQAPLACRDFTIRVPRRPTRPPTWRHGDSVQPLREIRAEEELESSTALVRETEFLACLTLEPGNSRLEF